ncbi:acyltransferase family protein [Corynebacterium yudongzhengii]|uniref:acyltransferase family protein n=1 Tax=Corynebacterium yudongzhengii TaxID=2080740 RepID=UPI001304BCB9|nr:acyltransferase family protein [Corynebacterium yudongzhengii]
MAATKQRLAWPDVAKGISILGVVLLHLTIAVPDAQNSFLAQANRILDPLRMPLFFLISGFFSAKILKFSFRELFTRRLWFFLVPYTIWVPVEVRLKMYETSAVFDSEMPALASVIGNVLLGVNMAWFLYALVWFNIFLWAVRKLPSWAGFALSFSPLLTLPWHFDYHMFGKAVLYLPIFVFGCCARRYLRTFAERCLHPTYLAGTAVLYAVGLAVFIGWARFRENNELILPWPSFGAETIDTPAIELPVRLITQFLMLAAGITLAVVVAKIPLISPALQFIGRHTLPVYIGHPIALTVLYHYTQYHLQIPVSEDADHWIGSTGFWMAATFAICIIGGLSMWALSQIPVIGWTVTPPPIEKRSRVREISTSRGEHPGQAQPQEPSGRARR